MKIAVLNKQGEKVKDLQLSKAFDVELSDSALALYIDYLRNSMRDAIANTKDRSEVSGGGKKPWKQKGTGRARQGSSRSPLWVGGGVTFGPSNEQNFKLRINKTLKKKAIIGSIAKMIVDKKGIMIDDLSFDEVKTKTAVSMLGNVKVAGKISIILAEDDKNADLVLRNIAGVKLMTPNRLNVIDILSSDNLIISERSLEKLESNYGKK